MKRAIFARLGDASADFKPTSARAALERVAEAPRSAVFAGRDIAARHAPGSSVILGDRFAEPGEDRPGGAWGNYLAFGLNPSIPSVERAALTGMPLYWAVREGGVTCASHVDLLRPPGSSFAVDWEFVAHSLAFRNLRTERTGLMGVRELLPGTRLVVAGSQALVEQRWSPWPHVARSNPLPLPEIAPALEDILSRAVASWVSSRPEIILELSGGLDSSIVAAALAMAGANFSAINFATPDADGDERFYARAVAARCNIAMREVEHDDRAVALTAPPERPHFRPGAYAVLGGIDRAFDEAVPNRDVAVFGGIGGDNVFAFDNSVAPILDAAACLGLGRKSFGTMRNVARAANASIWDAARLSWRAWKKGPRTHWDRDLTFLEPAAVPARPFEHPWDAGASEVSQAKRNHVEAIRRILDFLDRPERWNDRDVVTPLLSQPLVEYCLGIPSWTWVSGGRDRAVARAAFAAQLPAEVIWRRGKGRIESLCVAAYLGQRPALRELLLGGRLAARGLLDLAAIESYLARDNIDGNFDYFRLLEIADAERWVRSVEALPVGGSSFDQR